MTIQITEKKFSDDINNIQTVNFRKKALAALNGCTNVTSFLKICYDVDISQPVASIDVYLLGIDVVHGKIDTSNPCINLDVDATIASAKGTVCLEVQSHGKGDIRLKAEACFAGSCANTDVILIQW